MRLEVYDVWTWIEGKFQAQLLDPVTSYMSPSRYFVESYKKGIWDGRVRYVKRHKDSGRYYFPTGIFPRVTRYLRKKNIYHIVDDKRKIEPCQNEPVFELAGKRLDLPPYDYQARAVEACLVNGRGIVQTPTGSGKSLIGIAVIKTLDLPAIWLTHRLNLLYQTRRVMEECLGEEIGIVGDSQIDYRKFTIGMVQSLCSEKHREFLKTREVVVGDEIHHLESTMWYDNFASCPAPYRFGLSATPCLENDGLSLLGMAGDIIYQVSAKDLVDRGVLCQPRIFFIRMDNAPLDSKLRFAAVYSQGIVENEDRNRKIIDVAKTFRDEGKNCLTLVNRVSHGKDLTALMKRSDIRSEFVYGKSTKEERDQAFEDLFSGKLDNIVATAQIVGEGSDFPQLECLINATGGKGGGDASDSGETGRVTIQILGRGMRKHPKKKTFDYVDFLDNSHRFLKNASRDRISTLRSEGYTEFIDFWENRKNGNGQ